MSNKGDILLRKKIAALLVKAKKIVANHKSEYHGIYTCSGGGGTTTSNNSSTVPPDVLAEYNKVTAQANQVAATPLQQYSGQIVAGLNPTETSAFNTIDNMQGITAPYTSAASNLIGSATQNINPNTVTAGNIQNYESPYTHDVLQAAIAAQNNQDAQQQQQLTGDAISAGAWGGDRAGVAQGILGGQQAIANNATNAGILNQGYAQAVQEANAQQAASIQAQEASQQLQLSGGLAQNQLGLSAQQAGLTGANAQLASGQVQQQQTQAGLSVPYEQFLQQQAYPFQTTGWLGNIAEGIGSNEGGTSTSSTTQPSQGLFGFKRGGGIVAGNERSSGGIVPGISNSTLAELIGGGAAAGYFLPKMMGSDNSSDDQMSAMTLALAKGGIVPRRAFGGKLLPDVLSIGGDIVGAFFGDPMAGSQATGVLNKIDGGKTDPGVQPSDIFNMNRGGIVPQHFEDGGSDDSNARALEVLDPDGSPDNQVRDYSAPAGGIAPPPTPPVSASDHPNNMGYEAEMPTPHEANPWLSVAAGVLGTLAGRSRNPLIDIGQGGLIGLNNYAQQQQVAEKQNYEEGNFHQNAQKFMDEVANQKQIFANEKQKEADTQEYRKGQLAHEAAALQQNQNEVIKDVFGNPTGTFNKTTGKFVPLDATSTGSVPNAGVPKDIDGTPLTPMQMYGYKNLITKQQPKDIATENTILPSLLDQKTKVDDAIKQIPLASSGDLHTLQDFADRNQIPVFSDPARAAATVAQNYDSMGNVIDNVRSSFQGTGRVLAKEFEGLQNELSVNKSASPEQKAVVMGKVQARLDELIQNETQRAQDIRSGKAYLPSYQSPEQQRLISIRDNKTQSAPTAIPTPTSPLPAGSQWSPSQQKFRDPSGKFYDKNGNPI